MTPRDWLVIVEPPRRDWLLVVEPAPAFAFDNAFLDRLMRDHAFLGTLMEKLGDAAQHWHNTDLGEARKVEAAEMAMRHLLKTLHRYQPESTDHWAGPVMALLSALDDVANGRNPPQWLRPKLWDRAPDPLETWTLRANAAFRLQQLIDLGMSRKDAQVAIFNVMNAHSVEPRTPATVYNWLRRLREGRAPPLAVHVFEVHLDIWRPALMDGDPAPRRRIFLENFARELELKGHARTR